MYKQLPVIHQPNLRKLFTSQMFQIHNTNTNSNWVPTTLWCHWVWDLQTGNIRGKWKSFRCMDCVKLAVAKLSVCAVCSLPTHLQCHSLHTRESHPPLDAVDWHWHSVIAKLCLTVSDRRAHQAPLSTGFPRQGYRSGFPFASPGDLPNPGIEPKSPALVGRFFTTGTPEKPTTGIGSSKEQQDGANEMRTPMGFHADLRSTRQDVGSLSERLVCSGGQKAYRELRKR